MSNRSRARHVLYADEPDPEVAAEAEAQTDRMSRVADAFATPGYFGCPGSASPGRASRALPKSMSSGAIG